MAFTKGNGGTVKLNPSGTNVNIPVGRWKMKKSAALANTTNSTSAGRKNYTATVKDAEGSFEGPWDDAINEQASAFGEGTVCTLELAVGSSGKKYTVVGATIETFELDNDEDEDVTRYSVTWKGATSITYA